MLLCSNSQGGLQPKDLNITCINRLMGLNMTEEDKKFSKELLGKTVVSKTG